MRVESSNRTLTLGPCAFLKVRSPSRRSPCKLSLLNKRSSTFPVVITVPLESGNTILRFAPTGDVNVGGRLPSDRSSPPDPMAAKSTYVIPATASLPSRSSSGGKCVYMKVSFQDSPRNCVMSFRFPEEITMPLVSGKLICRSVEGDENDKLMESYLINRCVSSPISGSGSQSCAGDVMSQHSRDQETGVCVMNSGGALVAR